MELSRAVNGDAFAKVVQLHRQLEKEQGCHAEVVGEWFSFADIIGKSAVLRVVLDQIQKSVQPMPLSYSSESRERGKRSRPPLFSNAVRAPVAFPWV